MNGNSFQTILIKVYGLLHYFQINIKQLMAMVRRLMLILLGEYTYPQYMTMPYIDCSTIPLTGWIEAKEINEYTLTPYPNYEGLAEYGGVFMYENAGGDRLNLVESVLSYVDNPILSIDSPGLTNINIPSSIFDDEITIRTSPYYLMSSNDGIWEITSSDNYNNGWNNYKIFNKEHGYQNAWLCNYNVSLPQYIQWKNLMNEKTKLNSYSIMMAYENSTKYGFKKWKFEGSNDNNIWELIDEQELDVTPSVGTILKYNLNNTYEYSSFKFTILDGRENGWTGIDEIETFYTGKYLI